MNLRIDEMEWGERRVKATFPSFNVFIQRFLAIRRLLLARGRSNKDATITALGLGKPKTPTGGLIGFVEADVRGGQRTYHAKITCDPVTEDVRNNPTAIAAYVVEAWPTDDAGDPIDEADGGHKRRKRFPVTGTGTDTEFVLPHLDNPARFYWRFQLLAEDIAGKLSDPTAASDPEKPANFGPPVPQSPVCTVEQDYTYGEWEAPDGTETEADGALMLDRRVAYFKRRLKKDGVVLKPWRRGGKAEEVRWRNPRPGGSTYRLECKSVDYYGNESAVAFDDAVKGEPPAPTGAPTVVQVDGGKEMVTFDVTIPAYSGVHDLDDITKVIVEAQFQRTGVPVDADPVITMTKRIKPGAAVGPFTVQFKGIKEGKYARFTHSVSDTKGHQSNRGPWGPAGLGYVVADDPSTPPLVSAITVDQNIRQIIVGYTVNTPLEVEELLVEISHNNWSSVYKSKKAKDNEVTFKAAQGLTGFEARVTTIGKGGKTAGPVYSAGDNDPDVARTADIIDDGTLDLFGSIVNVSSSDSGDHVSIDTGNRSRFAAWKTTHTYPGEFAIAGDSIYMSPPRNSIVTDPAIVIDLSADTIYLEAAEIEHGYGVVQSNKGYCSLHRPASVVTANDRWGDGFGYQGCTRLGTAPSSIGFSSVGGAEADNNVKAGVPPYASSIGIRGFTYNVEANASAAFLRAVRNFAT